MKTCVLLLTNSSTGFPGGSDGKESACNARDLGSIPGVGRSPGGEHGNPLQYSCLENSMDKGAWWATVHGVTRSQTRLSKRTHNVPEPTHHHHPQPISEPLSTATVNMEMPTCPPSCHTSLAHLGTGWVSSPLARSSGWVPGVGAGEWHCF